jgi:hypothetical protein
MKDHDIVRRSRARRRLDDAILTALATGIVGYFIGALLQSC